MSYFVGPDIITFHSLQELDDYITIITGVREYLPTGELNPYWREVWQEVAHRTKFTFKWVNGKYTWTKGEYEAPGKTIQVGEFESVSSNTAASSSGSAAQAIGGGGVKSAPTVTEVITEDVPGGASTTSQGAGIKTTGIAGNVSVGTVIAGLMAAYGLYTFAVTASNWHTWEDVFNTVFPGALPQNATFEDVKTFAEAQYQMYIGGVGENPEVYINEDTAKRLYDFLADYMEEDGTYDELSINLEVFSTTWRAYSYNGMPSRYYKLPPGGTGYDTVTMEVLTPSDNLIKSQVIDAMAQFKAMGYTISKSVADTVINSVDGFCTYAYDASSGEIANCNRFTTQVRIQRTDVPLTQPVALAEIRIAVQWDEDPNMDYDPSNPGYAHFKIAHASTSGDSNMRMLRYGAEANDVPVNYAYRIYTPTWYGYTRRQRIGYIEFPANEMQRSFNNIGAGYVDYYVYCINGWDDDAVNIGQNPPTVGTVYKSLFYSNVGYSGTTKNYKPNNTLSTIAGKKEGDKLPAATGTGLAWDDRYMQWAARSKQRTTVDKDGNNQIVNDIPVSIPFGKSSDIINHGYNNPNDPQSPTSNISQNDRQSGIIPDDTPIDGINDAIKKAVDTYNDSQYLPETLPDPSPTPLPDYPIQAPSEPKGDSGDTPTPSAMTGVTASGMCSVYNPTKTELMNFSAWLWSDNFLDNFLKIFQNPMDAIIGLHIMYATPHTTTPSNIIAGYLDSGVSAKVVDQQFTELDCGTVNIPEYYGDARDYEPYVQVHCYLPFVGIVSLKPNDVIGKQLNIKYGVDAMTGTCLAILTTKKGNSDIACYNFAGNCATQVPISGGSYAQMITGLAGIAASAIAGAATGNPLALLGAGASILNTHLDVSHSGSIGANAGAMGIRKPYLIITRKAAYDAAGYSQFYGYPSNLTTKIRSCRGYVRVKSVHIDSIGVATDTEKTEIETLLKQGVIIQ